MQITWSSETLGVATGFGAVIAFLFVRWMNKVESKADNAVSETVYEKRIKQDLDDKVRKAVDFEIAEVITKTRIMLNEHNQEIDAIVDKLVTSQHCKDMEGHIRETIEQVNNNFLELRKKMEDQFLVSKKALLTHLHKREDGSADVKEIW